MRMNRNAVFAFSALVAIGASDIAGQQQADVRRQGSQRGLDVEQIMSMREGLELTDAQLSQLESIRRESVQRRNAERAEMEEMRSQLRAGQIRQSEMMAFLEERQDARAELSADRAARFDGILTETQREQLAQSRRQLRTSMRPGSGNRRGGIRNGRGGRSERGIRGSRGVGGEQGFRGTRDIERGFRGAQQMRNARPGVRRVPNDTEPR